MQELMQEFQDRHIENTVMSIKGFHVMAVRDQPAGVDYAVGVSMIVIGAALNILKDIGGLELNRRNRGK